MDWTPIIPVMAALAGGVLALGGVTLKSRLDRIARVEAESREERFSVYRRLAALLQGSLGEESRKQLAVDIMLFGSDEMTRCWVVFLDKTLDGTVTSDSPEAAELWAKMLLAMRRDAGRPGTGMDATELLAALGVREGRDPTSARPRAVSAGLARPKEAPETKI